MESGRSTHLFSSFSLYLDVGKGDKIWETQEGKLRQDLIPGQQGHTGFAKGGELTS